MCFVINWQLVYNFNFTPQCGVTSWQHSVETDVICLYLKFLARVSAKNAQKKLGPSRLIL